MTTVSGTGIGAVNDSYHLRVYTQDISGGIRESICENGWSSGRLIAYCKLGSPIAATSLALDSIRVYSVSNNNTLQEAAHDANSGWYSGGLTYSNIQVAANSSVGAVYLAGTSTQALRVYAQLPDNSIQEYGWDTNSNQWQTFQNLGAALPGTAIAVTTFLQPDLARVYFQDPQNNLIEMAYDANSVWGRGSFSVPNTIPQTALAVTTTEDVSIHVYYGGPNNLILEKIHDANSGWYVGGFPQSSIPGGRLAAINWGADRDFNIRVYFQQAVSYVTEYQWTDLFGVPAWSIGQKQIPPA
ncbi:hypothetical protein Asppvi_010895 [Aspergillus pseudoviridinutans]|uniref:Fucose-specific lectin n=1 Tax=Aspergillus pseudoviridinutans TaxID=1517512 RepID=A0A9P3BMB3_9EURO|nr:uncharacterized protein Asppvi_010895 [Aspergillus pseudoviridinutans]GIJ91920.1 hypothetical protein Asppvi_010895 [Aspergillus pseudoviridinutans]